jgi:protein-S-isoprenylcysteine O-methyltransferase Ste14
MIWLRIYLLAGLIAHKSLWELFKAKQGAPRAKTAGPEPLRLRIVKAVKLAILAGVALQTLLPEVLRIEENPGALRAFGVALYTIGLLMALISRVQLADNWSDIEKAKVLENQVVVSKGLYRYIRHPIYVGDLLLLIGLELSLNSWLVLGVILLLPVVIRQAVSEEKMLLRSLPGYETYCARTKRFIPFLI